MFNQQIIPYILLVHLPWLYLIKVKTKLLAWDKAMLPATFPAIGRTILLVVAHLATSRSKTQFYSKYAHASLCKLESLVLREPEKKHAVVDISPMHAVTYKY